MRITHGAFAGRNVRVAAILCLPLSFALSIAHAQQPAITLAKSSLAPAAESHPASAINPESKALRENYREFAAAKVGRSAAPERFTFEFHATTKVTDISVTPDFRVAGGTCITGHVYAAGDVCNVEIAFTPQGPGHRTGKLSIAHSASVAPLLTPIGGTGYAPAISFTPSLITSVPGTYSSTTGGALLNPQALAIDGGDNLYIADTGNNLIRFRDSSGAVSIFAGGGATPALGYGGFGSSVELTNPSGVAVDYSGTVYISSTGDNVVLVRYLDGILNNRLGDGSTTSCPFSSPCSPGSTKISPPYSLATDASGNLYVATKVGGSLPGFYLGENDQSQLTPTYYTLGTTAYNYYSTSPSLAVDSYSNLYYTYEDPGGPLLSPTPLCYVLAQNRAYSTSAAGQRFWSVAGSGKCGFSGDNGRATGAEISTSIGQFALDAAGNFYFADTGNNRIRRVDVQTGVIRTVAGNGGTGFSGDGGPSTSAHLQTPVGLAVDSNGSVYSTGLTPASGAPLKAGIRTFGGIGKLIFSAQALSTHSAAQTVLISNVGNDTLNFTHVGFSSGNTTDFAIDPNTTSCNFTAPLYSGQSCSVGFIFTPAAVGARSTVVTILDNTVNGVQTIQLIGSGATAAKGALSPTSLVFASQTVATSSAAKVITLTNTGGLPLGITGYTFSGANAADFAQTHTCGTSLAAAQNCTIRVVFKPAATGTRTATLSVATSSGTLTATLSGTGAAAAVKPKVTLKSTVNPAPQGHLVLLTSNVVADSTARVTARATGVVQVKEGSKVLAEATIANGLATFRLGNLAPGAHVLKAVYLGDRLHQQSASPAMQQVVGRPIQSPNVGRF